jgi:hypothetical protein
MRAATDKFGVIEIDGKLVGVALGYEFCAEHEWGFRWRRDLGIPEKPTRELLGVESRTNTKCALQAKLFTRNNGEVVLIGAESYFNDWEPEEYVKQFLPSPARDWSVPKDQWTPQERKSKKARVILDPPLVDVRTAWADQGGFLIVGQTDKGKEAAKIVYDALVNHRLAVGYGLSSTPFDRGGLNMVDTALLSEAAKQRLHDQDAEWLDIQDAAAASGIIERLAKAGLRYFALSPEWADKTAKTGVHFWLNPIEQDRNNWGWFTVEDLDAWIAGKGPIPKATVEGLV